MAIDTELTGIPNMTPEGSESGDVAVLASGGLDSAVLCVELAGRFRRVHPIYVRFGLRWESTELAGLHAFLTAVAHPAIERLRVFDEPLSEVYGDHWSTEAGGAVPDGATADEEVCLPGRNLLLIAKAAVWCGLRGVSTIALGTLGSNPFPDATPTFFRAYQDVLNRGMNVDLRIIRPFEGMTKVDVLRLGARLPLELTVTCLDPVRDRQCGACNKCAERRRAFAEAGIPDRTVYLAESMPTAGPHPAHP